MNQQPTKDKWSRIYALVILANILYVLLFYLLMNSF